MLGMFNGGSISNFCSVCLLNKRYSVFGCQNNAKIIAITGLKVHHRHYTPTIFNINTETAFPNMIKDMPNSNRNNDAQNKERNVLIYSCEIICDFLIQHNLSLYLSLSTFFLLFTFFVF